MGNDILDALGIGDEDDPVVLEEVGGVDMDLVREIEEELGAIVKNLPPAVARAVAVVGAKRSQAYEGFVSASMARVAEFSVRPNASLTFYGPTAVVGTTYAAGAPITLVPRTNNVPDATKSTLAAGVTIVDFMVSPVDASAGWRLTNAKLGSDPLGSVLGDTSIDVLRHDLGPNRSPLRTYLGAKIKSDTQLTFSMVHDRAAAQELIGGVTVTLIDRRCAQPGALEESKAKATLANLIRNAKGPLASRLKLMTQGIQLRPR